MLSSRLLHRFKKHRLPTVYRSQRSYTAEADWKSIERDVDKTDVLIVGAGPAGLTAAIRIKQLCQETGKDLRVCVLEKASQLGAHSLSGAVLEPKALKELFPESEWEDLKKPGGILGTPATKDSVYFLFENFKIPLPVITSQQNHGNYIVSVGDFTIWLGQKAEEMGVEIYAGYPGSEVLYDENGHVKGVATGDSGITKKGEPGPQFTRGLELHAPVTIFAEGCRGSCTRELMEKFDLNKDCDPQTYGLGVKEIWKVDPSKHRKGSVTHTIGWPTPWDTWAGSFAYHYGDNLVSLGYVVGLDYSNVYLSPYQEFQNMKNHKHFRDLLEGATPIFYGARALNEGGIQSIPQLAFPGGVLVGCAAGFLNVAKIKGTHTAMKSGMLAAEAAFNEITKEGYPTLEEAMANDTERPPLTLSSYPKEIEQSWVYKELHEVRNIRPSFNYGMIPFMIYSGMQWLFTKGKEPWTFHHHADHTALKPASQCKPIVYPKPDGKITFDILTNLARSGTNHNEDQPSHLTLKKASVAVDINLKTFAGPEARYCPAQVYEFVKTETGEDKLVINAQNCLHCKTCDIKDPTQNIVWKTPEGGGGPAYSGM